MPGQQIPRLLGVIGAGQMGAGIAQVAASKGVPVVLVDVAQRSLDHGLAAIQRSLAKQVQKQHTTQEEADKTSAYIRTSLSLKELKQADFIIEAVSESDRLKKSIFEQLGKTSRPDAILASNTSSISITRIAAATARPQQVSRLACIL